MSQVTHMNESCHTCAYVMSHMWMSRVTRVTMSCHTCKLQARKERCLSITSQDLRECADATATTTSSKRSLVGLPGKHRMTHPSNMLNTEWHMRVTWLSYVTRLFQMCDMIPSYVWHVCDMVPLYVWHDSFNWLTWLFHVCDMTLSYLKHDSFMCVTMTLSCVTWLIRKCKSDWHV